MAVVLVCDNVADEGLEILVAEHEVIEAGDWSRAQVLAKVGTADALVVRSGTLVDAEMIEAGARLRAIARAGVGVDNIDVAAATRRGIAVVNCPTGNTISAAEHAMGMMLAAARKIPAADAEMKSGQWPKKECIGRQLYGKTLGIVGLGRIGLEVAQRARAFEMKLLAADPFVSEELAREHGAELVALEELLARADFVTLHATVTAGSPPLLGVEELAMMKRDAVLVNCARGSLVDEGALADALAEGRLAAAALDVFANEPDPDARLVGLRNVVATPHVAASTEEAQAHVAREAARQVVDVLAGRRPRWPVNVPALGPDEVASIGPYLPLAEQIGRLHAALLEDAPERVQFDVLGGLSPEHLSAIGGHFLAGLLGRVADEPVNYVNAPMIAEERGVRTDEMRLIGPDDPASRRGYSELVQVTVTDSAGSRTVTGALLDRGEARIVEVVGFGVDLSPRGVALLIWNARPERPGFVGTVGRVLGNCSINILGLQVGHEIVEGEGLMAVTISEGASPDVLDEIRRLPDVARLEAVEFST